MRWRLLLSMALLSLAACSTSTVERAGRLGTAEPPHSARELEQPVAPQAAAGANRQKGSGGGVGPIAERTIDLRARCAQTEEDGFGEQAELVVQDNQVQVLSWLLWVGKRGRCQFELADFQQTKRCPHVELLARDHSGCKLMVWQDPRHVTLAHAGCENRCTPGVYEQAWPVMFDAASGGCSRQ